MVDEDALRFIWYIDCKVVCYRMTSHLFGDVWCASSSAYALKRIAVYCESVDPSIVNSINKLFYVDDFLKSQDSLEAEKFDLHEIPKVLSTGGFDLKRFVGNNQSLLHEALEIHRDDVKSLESDLAGSVLCIRWHVL